MVEQVIARSSKKGFVDYNPFVDAAFRRYEDDEHRERASIKSEIQNVDSVKGYVVYEDEKTGSSFMFVDLSEDYDGFLNVDGITYTSGSVVVERDSKVQLFISLTNDRLDVVIEKNKPRFNLYVSNSGEVLQVRYKEDSVVFTYLSTSPRNYKDPYNYSIVQAGGRRKVSYRVHRLVAGAFGDDRFFKYAIGKTLMEAHHINGDSHDNRGSNLILMPKELHRYLHGIVNTTLGLKSYEYSVFDLACYPNHDLEYVEELADRLIAIKEQEEKERSSVHLTDENGLINESELNGDDNE